MRDGRRRALVGAVVVVGLVTIDPEIVRGSLPIVVGLALAIGLRRALVQARAATRRAPLDFALARRQTVLRVVAGLVAVGVGLWAWLWYLPFEDTVTFAAVPPIAADQHVTSTCSGLRSTELGEISFIAVSDAGYQLEPASDACVQGRADRVRLLLVGELVIAGSLVGTLALGRPRRSVPLPPRRSVPVG